MKTGKQRAATIVALAIMGFGQLSLAAGENLNQFTPLERLVPSDRVAIQKYIDENGFKIDYDHYILGLDSQGQIALAPRSFLDSAKVGEPCSAGRVQISKSTGN
jgi:hypothetical protein